MRSWLVWLWVAGLGACVESNSVTCDDGVVCPTGTKCVGVDEPVVSVCVDQDQLTACEGLEPRHRCTTETIAAGRCYGGACIEVTCGNGRIDSADPTDTSDVGEICDDGGQVSADGCSSDCLSDETCGNSITDLDTMNLEGERCDDGNDVDHDGCTSACQPEEASWSRVAPGDPATRIDFAMAYDVARHEVVMFGGDDQSTLTLLGDTWVFDGRGWTQRFPEQSPSPRSGHTMAYDSDRQRVVLFGGARASNILADTWEWDGRRWIPIATLAAPPARFFHSMVYDAKRKRVVVFGGTAGGFSESNFGDTWLYDGVAWTQQVTATHPGGPPPVEPSSGRRGTSMAFAPDRGVVVLFGGSARDASSQVYQDDVLWELDASGWRTRMVGTPRPPPRDNATMTYDVASQRLLLFGGQGLLGDQWMLSSNGWTEITSGTLPPAREGPVTATDTERRRVVLFGGRPSDFPLTTWEWNGSAWTTKDTVVPPNVAWIGAFDSLRGRSVMVNASNETFELAGTSWIPRASMPGTYRVPEIAHDHAHARTVVVDIDDSNLGVTYVFDGTSWATPANAATPPLFTTAIGPTPDGLVMFSGFDLAAGGFSEATWTWNGFVWTNRSPAHHPAGRVYAAMAYDPIRKVTLLFGGGDSATAFRDTWSWDGSDWTEVTDVGPDARASAALAWNPYRRRMMLFGGTSSAPLADLFELDGSQWSPVAVSSQAPAPRADAVLVPESTSGSMLVFAGVERSGNALDDLWRIGWASDRTTDDCRNATDLDGDALAGCADPDCYYLCSPACTPGPDLATCATMGPRCGDTSCSALETCRLCPADCGVCTATCGDSFCDPGETATSCPGDC